MKKVMLLPPFFVDPNNTGKATMVEFDIAVSVSNTVSDGTENKKGLGIGVLRLDANISKNKIDKEEIENSSASRIKFSVPVYFQFDEQKRKELQKNSSIMMNKQNWSPI